MKIKFSLLYWLFWNHIDRDRRWTDHSKTTCFSTPDIVALKDPDESAFSYDACSPLNRTFWRQDQRGCCLESDQLEYGCSGGPGLGWWQRTREFSVPHNPVHTAFTPSLSDESETQAMCNCPAKARVSTYKEHDESKLHLDGPNPLFRRRQRHPTPVLLPGKSHGRRSLVGCSPWGC